MGKKGGEETSTVTLPPEITEASLANLDIANEVGAIGYQPNRAASIAGFSPAQMNGMQGYDQQASAFGMPSSLGAGGGQGMGQDQLYQALTGMAPPTQDTGMGFNGYSGAGMFDQAIEALPPAYRAAVESFTRDPNTGAAPTNLSVPQPRTSFAYNPATGRMEAGAAPSAATQGVPMPEPASTEGQWWNRPDGGSYGSYGGTTR